MEAFQPAGLKIEKVSLSFGNLQALREVGLEVQGSEILAIIGPNGAGKTCLLNCINGFYHPHSGSITFNDFEITPLPVRQRTQIGIARTFQNNDR